MPMILSLLLSAVLMSLRGRASLQLELVALRHQLAVLERKRTTRPRLTRIDRFFWVWLYRLWPGCLDMVVIVKPDTVIGWHRMGFRLFSTWKSRLGRNGLTECATRGEGVDPANEPRKPALGRASHSRQTLEAGDRDQPSYGVQAHGPPSLPAVTDLEDLPC